MGQTPSAEMVGSIIGVEEDDQFKPRTLLRKEMFRPQPEEKQEDSSAKDAAPKEYRLEIVWRNVMVFIYLHAAAFYGLYLMVTVAKWPTVAFGNNNNIYQNLKVKLPSSSSISTIPLSLLLSNLIRIVLVWNWCSSTRQSPFRNEGFLKPKLNGHTPTRLSRLEVGCESKRWLGNGIIQLIQTLPIYNRFKQEKHCPWVLVADLVSSFQVDWYVIQWDSVKWVIWVIPFVAVVMGWGN